MTVTCGTIFNVLGFLDLDPSGSRVPAGPNVVSRPLFKYFST